MYIRPVYLKCLFFLQFDYPRLCWNMICWSDRVKTSQSKPIGVMESVTPNAMLFVLCEVNSFSLSINELHVLMFILFLSLIPGCWVHTGRRNVSAFARNVSPTMELILRLVLALKTLWKHVEIIITENLYREIYNWCIGIGEPISLNEEMKSILEKKTIFFWWKFRVFERERKKRRSNALDMREIEGIDIDDVVVTSQARRVRRFSVVI